MYIYIYIYLMATWMGEVSNTDVLASLLGVVAVMALRMPPFGCSSFSMMMDEGSLEEEKTHWLLLLVLKGTGASLQSARSGLAQQKAHE